MRWLFSFEVNNYLVLQDEPGIPQHFFDEALSPILHL